MKLKLTNKKRAIQIGAFGVILVFVLGLVLNSNFLQAKADMVDVSVDDTIKILEIGPGNQSRLANGIGTYTGTAVGKNYTVTYMSMPEYISGIDDIAGKYDIVAITNKNDGLADNINDGNVIETAYTKYNKAFSSPMAKLIYSPRESNDSKNNNYNLRQDNGSTLNNNFSGNTSKYYEYYSENDITDKRAKEILDMANRGQKVYVEESALVVGSKLESNFKNDTKIEKVSNVSIDTLLSNYQAKRPQVSEFKVKEDDKNETLGLKDNRDLKFTFKYPDAPEKFIVKVYVDYNADGMFKEYQAGSGYRNELLVTKAFDKNTFGSEYEIDTRIYRSFIGFLDWKVEIYAGTDVKNSPKTSVLSSFIFKRISDNKKASINVLQVYPDKMNQFNEDGTYAGYGDYKDVNGLVLSTSGDSPNTNSQKFRTLLAAVEDYNVTVKSIPVTEFNNNCSGNKLDEMKSYDMIIIGFGDGYGGSYDFNEKAMEAIQTYIDNKAVMLSHDTVTLSINDALTGNSNGTNAAGTTRFTNMLKSQIGQSRYENDALSLKSLPSSIKEEENGDLTFTITCTDDGGVYLAGSMFGGNWGETKQKMNSLGDNKYSITVPKDKFQDGQTYSYKFVSKNDNNFWPDPNNTSKDSNGNSVFVYGTQKVRSYGQTSYTIRGGNNHSQDGGNLYEQSKTKTVREVGQGQITEYPYNLSLEKINNQSVTVDGQSAINVSQTHTQWYQLNLEDEDISPWFNLVSDHSYDKASASNFNSGDAQNFYYTYSKGNITYSGTGHTSNYTESELKLFVNTIIRAARGSKITLKLGVKLDSEDISTDINNPTMIDNVDSDYEIKFKVSGEETETTEGTETTKETETTSVYEGEIENKYKLTVYDEDGKEIILDTSGFGSGDVSGLNPVYKISSNTLKMLSKNKYKLAVTLISNIPDSLQKEYDMKVEAVSITAYVFVDEPEVLSVKHGMIKGNANASGVSEIETGCPEVDYYTSIPFEAQISGFKSYTNKTIELTIDKNFLLDEGFAPKVYKVSDGKLTDLAEQTENSIKINTEKQDDGTTKVIIDLGTLQTNEIIVRYNAKTNKQPEQTTEVGDDGINITKGENIVYTNTIKVTSKTSNSASASVQVGRVILDRPLF